jgi:integrase/recombinase XerD
MTRRPAASAAGADDIDREKAQAIQKRRRNGEKLSAEDTAYLKRAKAVQRANLPREISPHWLRHSHASHSMDRGAPVHVVQQTLGHASLTTTTRYTHARPGDSSAKYLPT